MDSELNNKELTKFIDIVRDLPILWNIWHASYKDIKRRMNVWKIVGQHFNLQAYDASKLFSKLKNKFIKLRKEKITSIRVGAAATKKTSWVHFEELKFLNELYWDRTVYVAAPWGLIPEQRRYPPNTVGSSIPQISQYDPESLQLSIQNSTVKPCSTKSARIEASIPQHTSNSHIAPQSSQMAEQKPTENLCSNKSSRVETRIIPKQNGPENGSKNATSSSMHMSQQNTTNNPPSLFQPAQPKKPFEFTVDLIRDTLIKLDEKKSSALERKLLKITIAAKINQ